jgi:hypothetical protein
MAVALRDFEPAWPAVAWRQKDFERPATLLVTSTQSAVVRSDCVPAYWRPALKQCSVLEQQ